MKTKCSVLIAALVVFDLTLVYAGELASASTHHSCCAMKANTEPTQVNAVTDKSLYQLDSTWTNDREQPVKLAHLKGHPQVVAMFFAHCQSSCPLLVYQMQQTEAALPANLRTNTGFLLVSFDTERDTPAALHAYRAQHELGANWTLLHGNADDVLDLAALLNVRFKKDTQGQFMHSNVITVLNSEGEIVYQQSGLGQNADAIIHALQQEK